jgi:hypothetical protein
MAVEVILLLVAATGWWRGKEQAWATRKEERGGR